jgi:hypothetical protein
MVPYLFDNAPRRAAFSLLLVTAAAVGPAFAAPETPEEAAVYHSERAACLDGSNPQGRKTCLYEAESAHAAMRRGLLRNEPAQMLEGNARQRCQIQPEGVARSDCETRLGSDAVTTGSVDGGGVLRQLTTRRMMPMQAASAPAR